VDWQWRHCKFFIRRQSVSSLIVGRIIDPRPGLRALSMDPFVPCVTHWFTIYPSLISTLFFFDHVQKDEQFAIVNYKLVFLVPKILKNCYCELKLYIIPIEENQDKITSVQGNTGRFKATITTTFHKQKYCRIPHFNLSIYLLLIY
jgi:hypothetical protein